jgi:isopentenyl diphosphate isomerase/L-lactate dehydrogenase-like FMN-dependent dehydrogenase
MALPDMNRRKRDHLRIAAGPGVSHAISSGLAGVRLRHRALPERDLADVSLDTVLLGARCARPCSSRR